MRLCSPSWALSGWCSSLPPCFRLEYSTAPTAPTPTPCPPGRALRRLGHHACGSTTSTTWRRPRFPTGFVATNLRVFGLNAFAVHLPQALAVLLLMLLGYRWANESFGDRAALYTRSRRVLTSLESFCLPRVFIPDVLLSLYARHRPLYLPPRPRSTKHGCLFTAQRRNTTFRPKSHHRPHSTPTACGPALALAVLTKGLVAHRLPLRPRVRLSRPHRRSPLCRRLKPATEARCSSLSLPRPGTSSPASVIPAA